MRSWARGEAGFWAPAAAAASRTNTGMNCNRELRAILYLLTVRGGSRRSVVSGNPNQRGFGCAAQHSLGILRRKTFYLGRNVHGTEFRAAHRAEVGVLEAVFGQRLVVHRAGRLRVERKFELSV